jgi:hypothetical protein
MIISSISSLLHSRFFASIRGSKSLNESALRGRIALPGGTPALLEEVHALDLLFILQPWIGSINGQAHVRS